MPKDIFINAFFKAKENVQKIKEIFKDQVELYLTIKNYENNIESLHDEINEIDKYLPIKHNKTKLQEIIH